MKMAGQSGLSKARLEKERERGGGGRQLRSICVLSSGHSIKLTDIFGICISIWSCAKEERSAALTPPVLDYSENRSAR